MSEHLLSSEKTKIPKKNVVPALKEYTTYQKNHFS